MNLNRRERRERKGKTTEAEVWLMAWLAVSASSNCTTSKVAANWADNCVASFRKRFPSALSASSAVKLPEQKS